MKYCHGKTFPNNMSVLLTQFFGIFSKSQNGSFVSQKGHFWPRIIPPLSNFLFQIFRLLLAGNNSTSIIEVYIIITKYELIQKFVSHISAKRGGGLLTFFV